jgi:hypothetical protein
MCPPSDLPCQERDVRCAKLMTMTCPLCGQRKARRSCPALHQTICPVCCGTKRLVEIACPDTCPHLTTAREHPPAVVKRQQQEDVAILLPGIRHLTERQYQLFFLFHTAIARHKPEGFSRLIDDDVAQAAGAVASTLETSTRGVIYEHKAQSVTAQRLASELTGLLAEIRSQGAQVSDGEAAVVFRAIEDGAKDTRKAPGVKTDADTSYLSLMGRLLHVRRSAPQAESPAPQSSLILP